MGRSCIALSTNDMMVDLSFHHNRYQVSMERQVEALQDRLVGIDLATLALLTGGHWEGDERRAPR